MTLARWISLLLLLMSIHGPAVHGQQVVEAEEHRVRAALLFNFAKFVTWPATVFANDRSPFAFCVLGEDLVHDALSEIAASKHVRGRRLVSHALSTAKDVENCQILFYSRDKLGELEAHRALWSRKHILTVGEIDGFIEAGGVIGLEIVDQHFAFDINSTAARRAGLEISASLLDLASRVIDDQGGGR